MIPPKGNKIPGLGEASVLKLCKNLHGLRDEGLTWHERMKESHLVGQKFVQFQVDFC